jgi:glycosyltransferase involved in cell wall biosynthesis
VKIVHLATLDTGNGAAIAAYRLHRGLRQLGAASQMFVAEKLTDDQSVIRFQPPGDLASRLRRRLRRAHIGRSLARHGRRAGLEAFSDDRSVHGGEVVAQIPAGDIINVHAMLDFVDYRAFFTGIPRDAAVVRTMHDMSFFTGGCHAAGDCERYTERCGACPQLRSTQERDLSRDIWERKEAALRAVRPDALHVVAPSTWLAREARRSRLLRDVPVTVIPNALDTEAFAPRDRGWAREVLGIPPAAHVALFVAEPITRRLKGFAVLAQALEGMQAANLVLVSVGSGRPPVALDVPHINLGQIRQERLMSVVYSAADVLVVPSSQEAFGLTAVEAMACGTPVVAFAVGGLVDTVRPGITGVLAPAHDVAALRDAIRDLLDRPAARTEMAASCRRVAVEEYALPVQARRYRELYGALLTRPRPRPAS